MFMLLPVDIIYVKQQSCISYETYYTTKPHNLE